MSLLLRPAGIEDCAVILELIEALAEYEKLRDHCHATTGALAAELFGPRPRAEVVIAEWEGRVAGFALYFHTFSTFLAKPGLYLEDLFVLPEHRGKGIGKALMIHLASLVESRGYGRLEWSVLDWNEPSIAFYESLGAKRLDQWHKFRLAGGQLAALAARKRN
ncbi:MAG: GNAT family N-acetyltransferase [Bryobacter sp.]|jgi:GNAT superfamily N-acetyltransferase|nr:GNAT family N-acetyltransferase [Bryobacter sp. CoA8 C33]